MTDLVVTAHDGIPLAVRDHGGDGPSIVLMHGAGMHLLSLELLAAELADHRVVTMDARWCGWSGDSPAYDWADLVRDVESVVDTLGLGNPVVAGHSWGGMIAAHYGVAHPDAPAVINLDGHGAGNPSLYDGMTPDEIADALAVLTELNRSMLTQETEGDDEWYAAAKAQSIERYRAMRVPDDQVEAWAERTFARRDDGTWALRPSPLLMQSLEGDLGLLVVYRAVRCPLLIFSCTKPQRFLPDQLNQMMAAYRRGLGRALDEIAAAHPNVEISTHEDIDHNSIVGKHAPIVADVMRRFVGRVSR